MPDTRIVVISRWFDNVVIVRWFDNDFGIKSKYHQNFGVWLYQIILVLSLQDDDTRGLSYLIFYQIISINAVSTVKTHYHVKCTADKHTGIYLHNKSYQHYFLVKTVSQITSTYIASSMYGFR